MNLADQHLFFQFLKMDRNPLETINFEEMPESHYYDMGKLGKLIEFYCKENMMEKCEKLGPFVKPNREK
jgi:hypothetical protein